MTKKKKNVAQKRRTQVKDLPRKEKDLSQDEQEKVKEEMPQGRGTWIRARAAKATKKGA